MSFPASMAAMVGRIPIIPTIAVTKVSDSSIVAISNNPSIPQRIFTSTSATLALKSSQAFSLHIAAKRGLNSRICCSINSTLLPAAKATTCKSLFSLTISNVWVPIEPVDPNTAIFFILSFLSSIKDSNV